MTNLPWCLIWPVNSLCLGGKEVQTDEANKGTGKETKNGKKYLNSTLEICRQRLIYIKGEKEIGL